MSFHHGDYDSRSDGDGSDDDHFSFEDGIEDGRNHPPEKSGAKIRSTSFMLWSRCIIHLDVDCFYCQCEELDGPPDYKERPIAIGQKHIVVTCNYVARKEGVKKLQSRTEAQRICPNLLIIEGSDLERYRQHSRRIYNAFRQGIENLRLELTTSPRTASSKRMEIPSRKGGMDEMYADLTGAIDEILELSNTTTTRNCTDNAPPESAYVYGHTKNHSNSTATISMTEDQSGAMAIINETSATTGKESLSMNGHVMRSSMEKLQCAARLNIGATLAERIRNFIREQTGFSTTIGVSISPMLAKLTSDLKKPDSLNILYPWLSSNILLPMPLRKIPLLGHRTLKALEQCLKQQHLYKADSDFWTCRELLQVPHHMIRSSLAPLKPNKNECQALCEMLLEKCRGVDRSTVEDDNGGLSKTVSVENSFRRDTITSIEAVHKVLQDLFTRLPRLLDERKLSSGNSDLAYPNTIRLTARLVDYNIQIKRRPFITKSKQCGFDGKLFMTFDVPKKEVYLKNAIAPLLNSLVFRAQGNDINITKLNIGVTNFADLESRQSNTITQHLSSPLACQSRGRGSEHAQSNGLQKQNDSTIVIKTNEEKKSDSRQSLHHNINTAAKNKQRQRTFDRNQTFFEKDDQQRKSPVRAIWATQNSLTTTGDNMHLLSESIDPKVLAELPPDIAQEIRNQFSMEKKRKARSRPASTLKHFFKRKKASG